MKEVYFVDESVLAFFHRTALQLSGYFILAHCKVSKKEHEICELLSFIAPFAVQMEVPFVPPYISFSYLGTICLHVQIRALLRMGAIVPILFLITLPNSKVVVYCCFYQLQV